MGVAVLMQPAWRRPRSCAWAGMEIAIMTKVNRWGALRIAGEISRISPTTARGRGRKIVQGGNRTSPMIALRRW